MTAKPRQDSKLLIDEPPLQVLPTLATRIGLNESIFVQQLHWMIKTKTGKTVEDIKWIYSTIEEWQSTFPFWSRATILRTISKLVAAGIVLENNLNDELSRRKWYALDYDCLNEATLKKERKPRADYRNFGQWANERKRMSQVETIDDRNLGHSIVATLDVDPNTETSITKTPNPETTSAPELKPDPIPEPIQEIPIPKKKSSGKRKKVDKLPVEVIPQPGAALIHAYYCSLPDDVRPPGKPSYSRFHDMAESMANDGITPYDVVRYMVLNYDGYRRWAESKGAKSLMSFEHVNQYIKGTLKAMKGVIKNEPRSSNDARPGSGDSPTGESGTGKSLSATELFPGIDDPERVARWDALVQTMQRNGVVRDRKAG